MSGSSSDSTGTPGRPAFSEAHEVWTGAVDPDAVEVGAGLGREKVLCPLYFAPLREEYVASGDCFDLNISSNTEGLELEGFLAVGSLTGPGGLLAGRDLLLFR